MNATTAAVDLAKDVYQLAVADSNWRVIEKHRLTRAQFERFFANRDVRLVVMEACGSAHYWGRQIQALGIEIRLLPPRYIRAYVKRNKTDSADAAAQWALDLEKRSNRNKAACALANKMARLCYATLRDRQPYA